MDLKKTQAPVNTVTYNRAAIEAPTDNIYEAITIIAKRANQINTEIKKELIDKLEEFATNTDSLDEVFENKEQDRKSTRLNSSHVKISYAVFCLKKKM